MFRRQPNNSRPHIEGEISCFGARSRRARRGDLQCRVPRNGVARVIAPYSQSCDRECNHGGRDAWRAVLREATMFRRQPNNSRPHIHREINFFGALSGTTLTCTSDPTQSHPTGAKKSP